MKIFTLLFTITLISCTTSSNKITEDSNSISKMDSMKLKLKDTASIKKHVKSEQKENKQALKMSDNQKKTTGIKNEVTKNIKETSIISTSKKGRKKNSKAKNASPNINFKKSVHKFGEIQAGDVINYKFKFTNIGNGDLAILNATAACGCTFPSFPFIAIKPNKTGEINVTYDSKTKWGDVNPEIKVYTNIRKEPYLLHLKGFVDDSKVKKIELQKKEEKQ